MWAQVQAHFQLLPAKSKAERLHLHADNACKWSLLLQLGMVFYGWSLGLNMVPLISTFALHPAVVNKSGRNHGV